MARHRKQVVLRTIEDGERAEDPVIRLGSPHETEWEMAGEEGEPVRLGPQKEPEPPPQPPVSPSEFRTHQPGIEALFPLENSLADPDAAENRWNQAPRAGRPVAWGWLVLVGLLFTGGVVWSILSVHKAEQRVDGIHSQTTRAIRSEAEQDDEAARLIESIESTVRAYLSARTADARLRWVRHRARVEPLLRDYEASHPVAPSILREIHTLTPVTIHRSADFWICSVVLENQEQRHMVVEITPEGPRIDWETLVVHQPMPWDDFSAQRPTGVSLDFRVYAEPAVFYSHEFADETQWTCYRLTTWGAEAMLFGYVRNDSQVARDLAALLQGTARASAILRVRIPPELRSPSGVVIESMVQERWLYRTPPPAP